MYNYITNVRYYLEIFKTPNVCTFVLKYWEILHKI